MLRVFLVIDDYNELMYLQTLLKKLGFDVDGVQNPKKYADLSLGFNPQVLIATARGKVVDGFSLAQQIKKRNGYPKIVLLRTMDQTIKPKEVESAGIDEVLESPINPRKLIYLLANIGSLDENMLLDKFAKMKGITNTSNDGHAHIKYDENGQPIEDISRVKKNITELTQKNDSPQFPIAKNEGGAPIVDSYTGQDRATPEHDQARVERFDKWLREMGPLPKKNFDRERIIDFNKKIRAMPLPDDIGEIEDERKLFVEQLYVKGSKKK